MGSGTGIGRVRGLGSARAGTHHWILARITALGNLVLVTWMVINLFTLPGLDYFSVRAWLGAPLVAVPMMLMLVSAFWHLRLGLQVLVEDYVHEDGLKFATILLLNFYAIGAAALGIFAVAKIAFASGGAS